MSRVEYHGRYFNKIILTSPGGSLFSYSHYNHTGDTCTRRLSFVHTCELRSSHALFMLSASGFAFTWMSTFTALPPNLCSDRKSAVGAHYTTGDFRMLKLFCCFSKQTLIKSRVHVNCFGKVFFIYIFRANRFRSTFTIVDYDSSNPDYEHVPYWLHEYGISSILFSLTFSGWNDILYPSLILSVWLRNFGALFPSPFPLN